MEKRDTAHTSIKEIEARTAELSLVMKHAATYRQLKPVYNRYQQSRIKRFPLVRTDGFPSAGLAVLPHENIQKYRSTIFPINSNVKCVVSFENNSTPLHLIKL